MEIVTLSSSTLIRRRKNNIELLQVDDGSWEEDQGNLKNMALVYFMNMYTRNPLACGNFLSGVFPRLMEGSVRLLCRDFTKEVVMNALKDICPLKAPGPNGFPVIFYKKCWNSVGDDIRRLVLKALKGDGFQPKIAKALLVLIPKSK